jgi:hypothetical protein
MASRTGSASAFAALFLVTSASCGLFLGDAKQPLCDFGGKSAPCGQCVASLCTAALSECCGSSGCREALDGLGTCTGGGTCGGAFGAAGASNMQSCVETVCAVQCGASAREGGLAADGSVSQPGVDGSDAPPGSDATVAGDTAGGGGDSGAPVESDAQVDRDAAEGGATGSEAGSAIYTTSCSNAGTAGCTCNAPDPKTSGAANSTECDKTAVPGSVCCADPGWPNPGTTCGCLTATCTQPGGGGCSCSLGTDGQTCNDGVVCCASDDPLQCMCTSGVSTCWTGYRQVLQCDAPSIGCGFNTQVTSCSIPAK